MTLRVRAFVVCTTFTPYDCNMFYVIMSASMRYLFLIAKILLFALTFVSVITYAQSSSMYPASPKLISIPSAESSRLRVNIANLERIIVKEKSEDSGILEIMKLLRDSHYEEMWAFIPHLDNGTWHEIGRDIIETVDGMAIRVDRHYLRELMLQYPQIHLYHFHPLSYFERCQPEVPCSDNRLPTRLDQISVSGFIDNVRYAMPSPEDIYFMMDISWEFDRVRNGSGMLRHRVVTPYGTVEYGLTKAGMERYKGDRNLRTGGLYISLIAGNALMDDAIAAHVSRSPGNIYEILSATTGDMTSPYLTVKWLQ